ncbi:MAG: AAA family ATPase [Chloroflexi bacterium]|nr:AAA family ATPase [Chloroflexota bacterium]
MILLKRIAAHNFKQLRDVDLTLPRSCRVLVEGLNEAGKSTLFEAVHFALYGRGLVVAGRGIGMTESLIAHRETSGWVELELLVGDVGLDSFAAIRPVLAETASMIERLKAERASRLETERPHWERFGLPIDLVSARQSLREHTSRLEERPAQANRRLEERLGLESRLADLQDEQERVVAERASLRREVSAMLDRLGDGLVAEPAGSVCAGSSAELVSGAEASHVPDRVYNLSALDEESWLEDLRRLRGETSLTALRERLASLLRAQATAQEQERQAREDEHGLRERAREQVVALGAEPPDSLTVSSLLPVLSDLATVSAAERRQRKRVSERAVTILDTVRERATGSLAQHHGLHAFAASTPHGWTLPRRAARRWLVPNRGLGQPPSAVRGKGHLLRRDPGSVLARASSRLRPRFAVARARCAPRLHLPRRAGRRL